jgi:NADPH:quinone reductase-like Zn-dependent oxidoreductase
MLAVTYSAHSSPDTMVFQSVPKPIPSSEEVLVKINVAAINPVDGLVIKGYMNAAGWKVSFPFIPGNFILYFKICEFYIITL